MCHLLTSDGRGNLRLIIISARGRMPRRATRQQRGTAGAVAEPVHKGTDERTEDLTSPAGQGMVGPRDATWENVGRKSNPQWLRSLTSCKQVDYPCCK